MMKTLKGIGMAALGAALVTALSAAPTEAKVKLNLTLDNAETSLANQANKKFAEEVAARTKGEVEIIIHAGGSLGYKGRESYFATRDGAIDIGTTAFDKLVGVETVYDLQSLPFLTTTIGQTQTMFEVAKPYFQKALTKSNMTMLYGAPLTPVGIWATRPITSIDDLKGLKIRTYDVTGTKVLKAAGAAPIQMAITDVVPALSTKAIDGILTSDDSGSDLRAWEYGVNQFSSIGYTIAVIGAFINNDVLAKLTPDHQKALMEAAKVAEKWGFEQGVARIAFNKERMAKGGAKFIEDVPAAVINHLKQAGAPLVAEWKQKMGPDADKIFAEYEKRMKK